MSDPELDPFEIEADEVASLVACGPSPGGEYAAMEADLRALMHRAAEAEFALAQTGREQTEATRKLLLGIIEVGDAFDRVFRSVEAKGERITPQLRIWLGNFRTVRRLLERLLQDEGVVAMDPDVPAFDPAWHRAVEVVMDEQRPDGTIVEQVKPGYLWHGVVLRKAEVIVARGVAGDSAAR